MAWFRIAYKIVVTSEVRLDENPLELGNAALDSSKARVGGWS